MHRFVFGSAAALVILALRTSAHADQPPPAAPAPAFEEARRAFKEERYRDAALGFEAADRARPDAVALYTAGQAWELAADFARAADAYSQALLRRGLDPNQATRTRERLAALGAELGAVDVTGPEGMRVELDDHAKWAVPARLHGTAGEHVLLVVHADGAIERRALVFSAGKVLAIDATPPAAPPAVTPSAPVPSAAARPPVLPEPQKHPVTEEPSSERSALWIGAGCVGLGAGVGALGGGLLLALAADDVEDAADDAPSTNVDDHAETMETQALAMVVVGGVLTATGAGILIWQATRPKAGTAALGVRVAPQRLLLEGRF